MSRLDDRLTHELESVARPADSTGVFERVDQRRHRRATLRRIGSAALAIVVIAGTIGGVAVLSWVFREQGTARVGDVSPYPITPKVNGRIVVASGSSDLVSMDPDGSGRQTIPVHVDPPGNVWFATWSPDSSKLAVTIFANVGGSRSIWVMNADGSNPITVAQARNLSQASWSPDGRRIAYAADTSEGSSIHIVNVDGSDDHSISDLLQGRDYFSATFSPDGNEIAYDVGTDSGFDIFVMDADGANVRRITTTGTDYNPSWSPDGSRIAFTRQGHGAQSDIYVMNADGSHPQQLTNDGHGTTNLNPTWAPDGSRIAFVAGVSGGPGSLVVMEPDGSHPVTIFEQGVLAFGWQALPASATPAPATADIGLGFPVCGVQTMFADFDGNGSSDTAYLATKMSDVGGCPAAGTSSTILAVDLNGDGLADLSYGPLPCDSACRSFGTPDLDGDGRADIAIIQQDHPVDFVSTYRIVHPGSDQVAVAPFATADPTATHAFVDFPWGSNSEGGGGAYCGSREEGTYRLAVWTASPNPDGTYAVTQDLYVASGGAFQFVSESNDTSVPQDQLPEGGGSTFCGVPVAP